MVSKIVDVFDGSGAKLFSYSIALEDEDCLNAEFEEVALIVAESSGPVAAEEAVHLRARCATIMTETPVEQVLELTLPKRRKNAVVSLVKHRMKRAGTGGHKSEKAPGAVRPAAARR